MKTSDKNALGDEIPVNENMLDASWSWAKGQPQQEVNAWSSLDDIRRFNDGRWLRVYGWMVVLLTVAFGLAFLAAFLIWGWHHIVPAKEPWIWLEAHQLNKIQSVLFSGGMGAIISGIIRAQLAKTRSSQ